MEEKGIKRYSLSKQVADSLEEMIEKGEYEVGGKIPTEIELMSLFKVSRNTVREAVQSLVSAGVLTVKQGDGTYVRSNNRFNANMSLKYSQVSIEDIIEARNALEYTIVYLAATRRTEEEMDHITRAYEKRRHSYESVKENTAADIEFHMAIAEACHNRVIIDLYKSTFSYLEGHVQNLIETMEDSDRIEEFHRSLYEAILNKDPEKARESVTLILMK